MAKRPSKKAQKLAEEYFRTGSVTTAGQLSGYKNLQSAWGSLHRPEVWAYYTSLIESAEAEDQLQALDNEAKHGNPSKGWVIRRLVRTVQSESTKETDRIRALSLICDIQSITRQPSTTTLQPVIIQDDSGRDIYEFSQQETAPEHMEAL